MNVILYGVIALIMVGSLLTTFIQRKYDAPVDVVTAQAQVDKYRMFMFVAEAYMREYSGGAGALTWAALRTAKGAPSGAVNGQMPSDWKVVVSSDMTWVACTPMDERALGIIQQMVSPNGLEISKSQIASKDFAVIGEAADAGKASLCN